MIGKIELRNPDGEIFLVTERQDNNAYIHANWIGEQSLISVMRAGNLYCEMLQQQPCSKLLNNHRELTGHWTIANNWIVEEWAPKILDLGVKHMAQVVDSDIFGQMSLPELHIHINDHFELRMFDNEDDAREWLLQVG